MKRLLFLVLLLPLLTACSKSEDPPQLALSVPEILLRSTAGSTATVTVASDAPWELSSAGSGYRTTPLSGAAGQTVVTITADEDNPDKARRSLGRLTFRITGGDDAHTLEVKQGPATAPQTMLLYMPGTSLINFYRNNIEGIKKAVSVGVPGDGRILVCYQPRNNSTAELCEILFDTEKQACEVRTLKTYARFDAGDAASVQELLSDVAEWAPALHYGLMIGCHGKAWVPAINGPLPRYAPGPDSYDPWQKMPGALTTRSFGDSGYELDIEELNTAITAQEYKLDYLIFDACFMANIETLYALRHAAQAIAASPCEIMGAGFPYDRAIPYLFTGAGTGYDLQAVCREFWKFYMYEWESIQSRQSACISVAVTSELENLAKVMRDVNAVGESEYDINKLQIYEGMSKHLFYDLGHLVNLSCADKAQVTRFEEQLEKTFPSASRFNTPGFYSAYDHKMHPVTHYSGVSVSEPSTLFVDQNKQTEWYVRTH